MKKETTNEENMIKCATDAILDRKGMDVVALHVGEVSPIADYFILASASNHSQLDALTDSVEEAMKKSGYEMKNREGRPQGGWVLLDYYDVIVHLFLSEMREFYSLDHTWRDVECIKYTSD